MFPYSHCCGYGSHFIKLSGVNPLQAESKKSKCLFITHTDTSTYTQTHTDTKHGGLGGEAVEENEEGLTLKVFPRQIVTSCHNH